MTLTRKRPTRMSDTRNQPMPYAHFCQTCRIEIGRTSHPARENAPPITCSKCKRQMREGVAA